jgi:heptose I phosphotransferase
MGGTGAVNYGSLWQRWARGVSWTWIDDRYRRRLPEDLDATVMMLESHDRFHAKQGRSTARFVFHASESVGSRGARVPQTDSRPLAVYLKRHYHLPWTSRLAALLSPGGKHSAGAAEWAHLKTARMLGIEVPDPVAAGERIGPRGQLSSFLMVTELEGSTAANELLPVLAGALDRKVFTEQKRRVIDEIARIAARLHNARIFHKDLYLCHFFVNAERLQAKGIARVALIDLHRLAQHTLGSAWWRSKDLGQLLFSTTGVAGVTEHDRLRFFVRYSRLAGLAWPRLSLCLARLRAGRYQAHNRKLRQKRLDPGAKLLETRFDPER